MTEHLLVLLVCLAVIAVLAILIYVASRGQISALTAACEVRLALQQILANTDKIDRSLHEQRRVLYDAHKRISTVTKGVSKPAL
jgi:Na+-translocating ferredoxin:NAD+ oxidoreductase RnfG subunit